MVLNGIGQERLPKDTMTQTQKQHGKTIPYSTVSTKMSTFHAFHPIVYDKNDRHSFDCMALHAGDSTRWILFLWARSSSLLLYLLLRRSMLGSPTAGHQHVIDHQHKLLEMDKSLMRKGTALSKAVGG